MLAIRMQRTGRKGLSHYRVIVQDSRRTPTSGRLVYSLGSYNPHTKEVKIDKEKASFYLSNGAQPSERVALILKKEGVVLPTWVKGSVKKESTIKNQEKLRKNQPKEETVAEETATEEVVAEETVTEETVAEETAEQEQTAEVASS
jgi:small subunit ribosomal protein S16